MYADILGVCQSDTLINLYMPRRSKVELSPETLQELENQFYSFLDSLSHEETKKFFEEFLTTEEKMMMYKRLALYWMLFEGYSLASIQRSLGVTHDTTRLYNKRKNQMTDEFKSIIHRIGRTTQAASTQEQIVEKQDEVQIPSMDEMVKEDTVQAEETTEPTEQMSEPTEETTDSEKSDEYIPSVESHENEEQKSEEKEMSEEETQEQSMEGSSDESAEEVKGEETLEMQEKDDNESKKDDEIKMESSQEATEEQTLEPEEHQNREEGQEKESQPSSDEESKNEEEKPEEKKKKGFGRFFGF